MVSMLEDTALTPSQIEDLYQISKSMTDIQARMLAKPAFVVTQIKKNGITFCREKER